MSMLVVTYGISPDIWFTAIYISGSDSPGYFWATFPYKLSHKYHNILQLFLNHCDVFADSKYIKWLL